MRAPTLVGRADELALGRRLVEDLRRSRGDVVTIEGEAGVGKSRLLNAWLATAGSALDVVVGTCDELESERPFGVLVRALGTPVDPDANRFVVVDRLADIVEERSLRRPVLLAVEDLHWADPATPLALHRLVSRCRQTGLLVVLTARPAPMPTEVDRLLAAVERIGGQRVQLRPLGTADTRELVSAIAGAVPGAALLDRVQGANGNPLFVTELVTSLVTEGSITVNDGVANISGGGTPASLRTTIVRQLASLSTDTLDVLRMAAMLGTAFGVAELATAMGRAPSSLVSAMNEGRAAGVLVERGDRLAFRHDLVRDAIYEDRPRSMRQALHLEVAERLADAGWPAVAVATHYRLGAAPGDERAITWLRKAATGIEAQDAGVAAQLLGHVVDLLPDDDRRRPQILAEQARLFMLAGRFLDAEVAARNAIDLRPSSEVEWLVRGTLSMTLAYVGRHAEALAERDILARQPRTELEQAMLSTVWAWSVMSTGDLAGALAAGVAGVEVGDRLGVPELTASGSGTACAVEYFQGNVEAAVRHGERAAGIGAKSFQFIPDGLTSGSLALAVALLDADRLADAEAALQTVQRQLARSGTSWILPQTHFLLCSLHFYKGTWDAGLAELDAGLLAADEVGSSYIRASGCSFGVLMASRRGETERANALLDVLATDEACGAIQGWEWWLTRHARGVSRLASGDLAGALALLREAWSLIAAVEAVAHYRLVGFDLAGALVTSGDLAGAEDVALHVEEAARRASGIASAEGAALYCRGLVASDSALLIKAVDRYRASPRRFERACAAEAAGTQLLADGARQDAESFLREAQAEYGSVGAAVSVRRVEARLREAGVRLVRRAASPQLTGWDSLTPTETEVVSLVCEGLTNRQVAEKLYVSTRTVDSHVAHVFGKLGVRSRTELAAHYAQLASQNR